MDFSDPNFSLDALKSIHQARCQKFLDVQHDSDKKVEAKNLKVLRNLVKIIAENMGMDVMGVQK